MIAILFFFILATGLLGYRVIALNRRVARLAASDKALPKPEAAKRDTADSDAIEALMSAMHDAVIAVDPTERVLFYNSKFAILFDLKSTDEKPSLYELIRRSDILEAFRTSIAEHSTTSRVVELSTPRNLERRYFNLSVTALGEQGSDQKSSVIGVFHDVTELKRAEQIRIDFVGNVSHELRTPLTSIKGYIDTLKDDVTHARFDLIESHIDVIRRNSDRLLRLVNDLLDLSSLESGSDLQKSVIPVREISEKIIGQLEPQRAQKDQAITLITESDTVFADPSRLEQVLVNLIENAIRYTPPKSQLTVAWKNRDQGAVELTISDTGLGISKEHLPRLFERFYRVDKARSREQGGTGLGLAIVKHIMQRHGGSVSVSSELGKGTSFHCIFPSNH